MNVVDFAVRKATGDQHETRVRDELAQRGCTVAQYGQGVLPEKITWALGRSGSQMRWHPDFVAARGSQVWLIDAKSSMRGADAHVYTISRKALHAHLRMWVELDLPVLYVFSNMGTATPAEVMHFCHAKTISDAAGYVWFPAKETRPFDETFGAPLAQAA